MRRFHRGLSPRQTMPATRTTNGWGATIPESKTNQTVLYPANQIPISIKTPEWEAATMPFPSKITTKDRDPKIPTSVRCNSSRKVYTTPNPKSNSRILSFSKTTGPIKNQTTLHLKCRPFNPKCSKPNKKKEMRILLSNGRMFYSMLRNRILKKV